MELARGNLPAAETHYRTALEDALAYESTTVILDSALCLSALSTARGNFLRTVELAAYVEHNPANEFALKYQSGLLLLLTHTSSSFCFDGQSYADGQPHELVLQGWTGLGNDWDTSPVTKTVMYPCAAVQIDAPTRVFTVRARVALATAKILDNNDPVRVSLLNALDKGFTILDTREPFGDAFYQSVIPALEKLKNDIHASGAPLNVTLTATGHAHIDAAWLWTIDQTRKKDARTFHTMLRLMEQFPEYHFTQSQPQLYEYIRQDHPELFLAIQNRIAEGRWESIGGMWVEAVCNLSGVEALARQFLLRRSYFREHFGSGAESPVLWLPDVFSYTWELPQFIKQAGLDYFFHHQTGLELVQPHPLRFLLVAGTEWHQSARNFAPW